MIGLIFERQFSNGKKECWKIVRKPYNSHRSKMQSWGVLKCSKTGKEYTAQNGFTDRLIKQIINEKEVKLAGETFRLISKVSEIGTKASTAGLKIGIKKRKIKWITAAIKSYQSELERLKKELES